MGCLISEQEPGLPRRPVGRFGLLKHLRHRGIVNFELQTQLALVGEGPVDTFLHLHHIPEGGLVAFGR